MQTVLDLPVRCHLCRGTFDRADAHDLHDDDCPRASGVCTCDLFVCPDCCPVCNPGEVA